ncbi:MAG: T9SS type A sorting domain-containing protein [Candidatus Kapabacteria bacterium]|nr:T9SS type A sorting domain-containing protein [Candidatus Kapabacteria bacterium]
MITSLLRSAALMLAVATVAASAQWQLVNTPFTLRDLSASTTRLEAPINSLSLTNLNNTTTLWGAGKTNLFRTRNGAQSWDSAGLKTANFIRVVQRGSTLFTLAKTSAGTMVYSSTDGQIWVTTLGQVTDDELTDITSNGRVIMIAGKTKGLYKSDNNGDTWRFVDVAQNCTMLRSIGSTIYAGTTEGYLFRSSDDGGTWENLGCTCANITCITTVGNSIVVGTPAGVCLTTNGGETWLHRNNNLFAQHITALVQAGDWLYAASAGQGVWRTLAVGSNRINQWQPFNSSLGNLMVSDMVLAGNTLWAGTQNGIYTFNLGFTVSVEDEQSDALSIAPNPATDAAVMSISTESASTGSISITDISGTTVHTQSITSAEGVNSFTLPVAQLSSGMYVARITLGATTAVRRFVVAR